MAFRVSVRVTVPKEILNEKTVRDALTTKQRQKTGPEIKALFRQTTEGFRGKPTWNQTFVHNSDEVSVTVKTGTSKSAEIYALVNAGSPPHDIFPKMGNWLRFQTGYTPASRPRYLWTHNYVRHGSFVRAEGVHHPGFEPREFDQEIAEQYSDTFTQDMQDAIKSAVPK